MPPKKKVDLPLEGAGPEHTCELEIDGVRCGEPAVCGIGRDPIKWYCQRHLDGVFTKMREIIDQIRDMP